MGSGTTQDVMNGLSSVIPDPDGNPRLLVIGSYDAVNPATGLPNDYIVTRMGHASLLRPDGSFWGMVAVHDDIVAGTGNFDFARSDIGPNATGPYTFVPFAQDAVTVAVKSGSALPGNLVYNNLPYPYPRSDLKRVYNCLDMAGNPLPAGVFPTINGITVHPLVPQAGSGLWALWASTLGFSTYGESLPPCVSNVAKDGRPVQENDGSALQRTVAVDHAEDLMPFSVASWIGQSGSATTHAQDRRHGAQLRSVDSVAPTTGPATAPVLNTAFPIRNEVYNIFLTSRLAEADIKKAFTSYPAGPGTRAHTASICDNTVRYDIDTTPGDGADDLTAAGVISRYGFAPVPDCGSATLTGDLIYRLSQRRALPR
ncbi:hypothetical protein ACFO3J_25200 [Streptomyces polygonati]|uniref:Uncharacterized protein n=1 Tax=Streptomyces polygonati TaxID=1617087 RepID=A0ABV8HRQ0_9ACTN